MIICYCNGWCILVQCVVPFWYSAKSIEIFPISYTVPFWYSAKNKKWLNRAVFWNWRFFLHCPILVHIYIYSHSRALFKVPKMRERGKQHRAAAAVVVAGRILCEAWQGQGFSCFAACVGLRATQAHKLAHSTAHNAGRTVLRITQIRNLIRNVSHNLIRSVHLRGKCLHDVRIYGGKCIHKPLLLLHKPQLLTQKCGFLLQESSFLLQKYGGIDI